MPSFLLPSRRLIFLGVLGLTTLFLVPRTYAQTSVTPASAVSNLCVTAPTATLPNIDVTETSNTGFGTGAGVTFILTAPAGFQFVAGTATLTFTTNRLSAG